MRDYLWVFGIPVLIILAIGVADFLFTAGHAKRQAKRHPR